MILNISEGHRRFITTRLNGMKFLMKIMILMKIVARLRAMPAAGL